MRCASVASAAEMEALGTAYSRACRGGGIFYLRGELGAGKTTFVRGFMRGVGYTGFVRSPTFTLVESYRVGDRQLHHLDLYRFAEAEELEFIGVRDYFTPDALCLVEWPERGAGVLPAGDILAVFSYAPQGRRVQASAGSPRGQDVLAALAGPAGGDDQSGG